MWRPSAPRIRSERTLPPPRAIALPSALSSNEPTTSASRARKASSPSSSNAWRIGLPSSRSISSSISTVSSPASRAAARAVDFPAPMKPLKTIAGCTGLALEVDPLLVRVDRGEDVVDVIAAELLAVGAGEGQRHHRLSDHGGGRNDR